MKGMGVPIDRSSYQYGAFGAVSGENIWVLFNLRAYNIAKFTEKLLAFRLGVNNECARTYAGLK
jgi:hypothetical protein